MRYHLCLAQWWNYNLASHNFLDVILSSKIMIDNSYRCSNYTIECCAHCGNQSHHKYQSLSPYKPLYTISKFIAWGSRAKYSLTSKKKKPTNLYILWKSSVIRRNSPSFLIFSSFFLLLFLLCGRHATQMSTPEKPLQQDIANT